MVRRVSPRRRWASRLLCAVALLAPAGCRELGLDGGEPPPEPPRLVFGERAHDVGPVPQGTVVEHRFPFRNQGGTELTIMNLRAACDCRATLVGPGDIAPEAAGAVQVRCDTDVVYGPLRRTVTVYSNDPAARAVMLTLTGEVALDVVADPAEVYLGVIPPDTRALREIMIRSGSDGMRIGPASTDAPQLVLDLAASPADIYSAVLTVGTAPAAPLGPFTALIRVPTTSRAHPTLQIKVAGIVATDAPTPRAPNGPPPPTATPPADDAGTPWR